MCETRKDALRIDFNQKLKLEFHGTKDNSDAGLPKPVKKWSLRTLHEKLIKIGAKGVRHSRYVVFYMAEVAVPRVVFREILDRIGRVRTSPEFAGAG